jgi:photoactive yellow protein
VGYNRAESELSGLQPQRVLGRNFFQEVAPCTAVKEFAGLYGEMVKAGKTQSWEFSFVFRFAGGDRRVHIQLAYFPEHERGMILVQP